MRVDMTAKIKDLEGEIIKHGGKEMDIAIACQDALLVVRQQDGRSGSEKMRAFVIAEHIATHKDDVRLSADDLKMVKDNVGKTFGPLVVGQVWRVLDPDGAGKEAIAVEEASDAGGSSEDGAPGTPVEQG